MDKPNFQPGELRKRVRKAAHDVRTPLTSIAGFAQLLVEDASLSADARQNAETVLGETERLYEMLENFFDEMTETLDTEVPTIDAL